MTASRRQVPALRRGRRHRRRRDRAQHGLPPGPAGVPRRRPARQGRAGLRLDVQGRRRSARAVLRPRSTSTLGARSLRDLRAPSPSAFGQEIDLHQVGYLFLLDAPEDVAAFEANVALQNELGVPSRMIDAAEAAALSPLDRHRRAARRRLLARPTATAPPSRSCSATPARPAAPAPACCRTARRPASRSATGGIAAVRTEAGPIETDTVVCAAGAWSRAVGAMVGVDLPVDAAAPADPGHRAGPGARPAARRSPSTSPPASTSTAEGRGLLLGMSDPRGDPGFKLDAVRRLAAAPRRGHRAAGARAGRGRHRAAAGRGCTR